MFISPQGDIKKCVYCGTELVSYDYPKLEIIRKEIVKKTPSPGARDLNIMVEKEIVVERLDWHMRFRICPKCNGVWKYNYDSYSSLESWDSISVTRYHELIRIWKEFNSRPGARVKQSIW